MKHLNYYYLTLTILLFSCTQTPQVPTVIITTIESPDRIRFSGKGAGAGMMLSGSMGVMGIAIGVAIDEGIGKSIDITAKEGAVYIPELFKQALQQYFFTNPLNDDYAKISVHIERYGFITHSGENDPVSIELKLVLLISDKKIHIDFPTDVPNKALIPTAPLDEIKTDAKKIKTLAERSISLALITSLDKLKGIYAK
jgi:hypothetical protein